MQHASSTFFLVKEGVELFGATLSWLVGKPALNRSDPFMMLRDPPPWHYWDTGFVDRAIEHSSDIAEVSLRSEEAPMPTKIGLVTCRELWLPKKMRGFLASLLPCIFPIQHILDCAIPRFVSSHPL